MTVLITLLLAFSLTPVSAQMSYSRGGRTIAPSAQQEEKSSNLWMAVVPGIVVVIGLGAANHFLKKKKEEYKRTH